MANQDIHSEQPDEPLSVRERRKVRALLESDLKSKMIEIGLDPVERYRNMAEAVEMIELLASPEGIVTNKEMANALGYPQHLQHAPYGKAREYMKTGYTMKITVGNGLGGKDRIFSKQGACLAAMRSRTPKAEAVRAWMAEVVAAASTHPDFDYLFRNR
ncbi:MAG: hypothetical protein IT552_01970 [Sphingomonadaceae bacterium]|nr:hypothetical protein [Sphingomonadaceae bacterium]